MFHTNNLMEIVWIFNPVYYSQQVSSWKNAMDEDLSKFDQHTNQRQSTNLI